MEQIGFNFIRLKEDCTELDGVYYGPLKNSCERI